MREFPINVKNRRKRLGVPLGGLLKKYYINKDKIKIQGGKIMLGLVILLVVVYAPLRVIFNLAKKYY